MTESGGTVVRRLSYLWLLLVLLFMIAPTVFVVVNSFNKSPFSQFPPTGFTMEWYQQAAAYAPFRSALVYSVVIGAVSTCIAVAAGTTAAIGLVRFEFKGRLVYRSLFSAPLVVPRVAAGFAGYVLFLWVFIHTVGNGWLVNDPIPLVLVHSLLSLPFVILVMSTTLSRHDRAIEEAARDLGANAWTTFVRVTLPILKVSMILAALLAFNTSFDEAEASIFLAPISGNTLPIQLFLYMEDFQTPVIAAVSTVMLAVTALLAVVASRVMKVRSAVAVGTGMKL